MSGDVTEATLLLLLLADSPEILITANYLHMVTRSLEWTTTNALKTAFVRTVWYPRIQNSIVFTCKRRRYYLALCVETKICQVAFNRRSSCWIGFVLGFKSQSHLWQFTVDGMKFIWHCNEQGRLANTRSETNVKACRNMLKHAIGELSQSASGSTILQ